MPFVRTKPDKPKIKRLVVLVSALDHKRLGKLAKRAGISTAEFVRQAVEDKADRLREVRESNGS